MQNLVSMIHSAVPTEVPGQAASTKADDGTVSELFSQLLQQFQGLSLEGDTEATAEVPSEGIETATVPEEGVVPSTGVHPEQAANGEAHESVLAMKQAVLEKLAALELPETVDREQLVAVIEQAFSQGLSPEVVAQVSALVEQGRSPEVLAQLEALLAPTVQAAIVDASVVNGANPEVIKAPEVVQPVTSVGSTKVEGAETPVVSTKTAGVATGVDQGKGPEGLEIPKTVSATEVKPDVQAGVGNPHREVGVHEASVKSVAPVVLAQLKEAGVKGITDEKVARVEAAVMKTVAPEVAVATDDVLPKVKTPVFAPPKVAPLVANDNGLAAISKEKGAEAIQGQKTTVPEPVKAQIGNETIAKTSEVVAPETVQVINAAGTEVVPMVKMTQESPLVVPVPLVTPPTEAQQSQSMPQEATPKSTETPTLRTAGDFTIRSVRHLLGSGEETIEVRLNPRSLGSLSIAVKTTGESVEIVVTAASPMVREMLEVQLAGLKESLMNDGVEVSKVRVESQGASQQNMSQSSSHQQLASSNGESKQGQQAQRGSGAHQGSEQDNGRPTPSESNRPSMHEGELNLIA